MALNRIIYKPLERLRANKYLINEHEILKTFTTSMIITFYKSGDDITITILIVEFVGIVEEGKGKLNNQIRM